MIPTFKFKSGAGEITARVEYVKGAPGSYALILWEKGLNKEAQRETGNFVNDDDDEYSLRGNNDGRYLEVTSFIPKIPDPNPPKLKVTVFQGGKAIGSVEEPDEWRFNSSLVDVWILLEEA